MKKPTYYQRHSDSTILILLTGPSIKNALPQLKDYIQKNDPIVIGCNHCPIDITPSYHFFVNKNRFKAYGNQFVADPKCSVIVSPYIPPPLVKEILNGAPYEKIMYHNEFPSERGTFTISSNGVFRIRGGTAGAIAVAAAMVMGAKKILIAGMDGHKKNIQNHYYEESDLSNINNSIRSQGCNEDTVGQANEQLQKVGGFVKIITPTALESFYDPSILKV